MSISREGPITRASDHSLNKTLDWIDQSERESANDAAISQVTRLM